MRSSAPRSQDRTPASATPRDPSLATNYRGSGLVLRRVSPVAPRPREGPLTEPIAGAQPRPQERVLMPLSRHSGKHRESAGWLPSRDSRRALSRPAPDARFSAAFANQSRPAASSLRRAPAPARPARRHQPAPVGEAHRSAASLHQSNAESVLELLDLPAERRLRDMQQLRRAGEISFARDCHEIAELP